MTSQPSPAPLGPGVRPLATGFSSAPAGGGASRVWPTREGRWGVRQVKDGQATGGGTLGGGWDTREAAEAANPPGGLDVEVYDRFGGAA